MRGFEGRGLREALRAGGCRDSYILTQRLAAASKHDLSCLRSSVHVVHAA